MAKTLLPTTATVGQTLVWNGTEWVPQAVSGSGLGDVSGPASATDGNIAVFDGATGKMIKDSGLKISELGTGSGDVTGPASATDSEIAIYDGITGKVIKGSGKSIADFATVNHLHANAMQMLVSLIKNGNFLSTSNWDNSFNSFSVSANEAICLSNASGKQIGQKVAQAGNHIFYYRCMAKTTSNLISIMAGDDTYWSQTLATSAGTGKWERLSAIYQIGSSSNTSLSYVVLRDRRTSGWDTVRFAKAIAIDLTSYYGVGNEPTLAEMDTLIDGFTNQWFGGSIFYML